MKLLSFAIPCYNSAEYMEKCIKSCLAGGDDIEVIIVVKSMKNSIQASLKLFTRRMVDMDRRLTQDLPMLQECSLR